MTIANAFIFLYIFAKLCDINFLRFLSCSKSNNCLPGKRKFAKLLYKVYCLLYEMS